ncbi:hypothetical protein DBV14_10815 [Variovorax sp. KBW07]|uniref:hypothetical protein n=1 Tax=Variovorax sp. KBW07 TaxID=2153358 RepID=UPI000F588B2A|nr:hypothetical protein [Variovorax sp. KBW07]RQO56591.1 hypothetical protein DBV14_10815 [Variovorax sp. KBW07]
MPMDFLRRIENASFPLAVTDTTDIHNVAVLAAAELIEAVLPPATEDAADNKPAIVLRITPMGRSELKRLNRESTG